MRDILNAGTNFLMLMTDQQENRVPAADSNLGLVKHPGHFVHE